MLKAEGRGSACNHERQCPASGMLHCCANNIPWGGTRPSGPSDKCHTCGVQRIVRRQESYIGTKWFSETKVISKAP